jgi:pyruvate,water dikinase
MKHQPLIKKLKAGLKADETGNKANSLIFLHHYGFNIPLTFLVTTFAHSRYLGEGIGVLDDLAKEIEELPQKIYAVRSSTTAEDSGEYSFAGQFQTLINISGTENILKAVQSVWDSAALLNSSEYLKRTSVTEIKCGVIIQEMIPSELAGVSFSRNPVTNQNEIVIEAVEGAGEDLVQKGFTPLRWRIRKNFIFEGNEQYRLFSVIRKVATDTARLRRYYGNHIDIEWVYDGKQLYYLQLRQITGRKVMQIYSNKMAKEMLPGQIKPLVWSVNIPMVNGTWINLLSEITGPLGIKPEDLVKQFYYQMYINTAELGKIFSEFGMSADSLEQLMIRDDNSSHSFKPGLKTFRHTFRIIKFLAAKMNFEKTYRTEYAELKTKCRQIDELLRKDLSLDTYNEVYTILFNVGMRLAYLNIVTPMLMAMHHKKLKNKLKKLNLDYDKLDFRNDFPQLLTYSPLPAIRKIKEEIEQLPDAVREKCISPESLRNMKETAGIAGDFDRLIIEFGHLSESGNDFSYPKWEENPELVFKIIMSSSEHESKSELYTLEKIRDKGIKVTPALCKAYQRAGRYKVYREQISSLYIFGYGLFRRLFLFLGKEIARKRIIGNENDIFYLSKDEIDSILEHFGNPDNGRFHEVIEKRKIEMEDTKDIVLPPVIYGEEAPMPETGRSRNHSGTGTSSGAYTGKTRVVKSIQDVDNVIQGEVLLIPFSDVSWTPILAMAGAIVSETGGMLSHSSIIARELGIPALVSVPNACSLGDGLTVTVNGSNGILTVHDYE